MPGFLVELDGKPIAMLDSLEEAKSTGRSEAAQGQSVKITAMIAPAPSYAYYWDYEVEGWVYSENAAVAQPRRRGQKYDPDSR